MIVRIKRGAINLLSDFKKNVWKIGRRMPENGEESRGWRTRKIYERGILWWKSRSSRLSFA